MASMLMLTEEAMINVKAVWASGEDSSGRTMLTVGFDFHDVPPAPGGEVFHKMVPTGDHGFTSWSADRTGV